MSLPPQIDAKSDISTGPAAVTHSESPLNKLKDEDDSSPRTSATTTSSSPHQGQKFLNFFDKDEDGNYGEEDDDDQASVQRKRRHRRRYDEIERLYKCSYEGCTKAYGTLNHLNHHVVLQKHGPKRQPHEFRDLRRWIRERKIQEEAAALQAQRGGVPYHMGFADGYHPPLPPPGPIPSSGMFPAPVTSMSLSHHPYPAHSIGGMASYPSSLPPSHQPASLYEPLPVPPRGGPNRPWEHHQYPQQNQSMHQNEPLLRPPSYSSMQQQRRPLPPKLSPLQRPEVYQAMPPLSTSFPEHMGPSRAMLPPEPRHSTVPRQIPGAVTGEHGASMQDRQSVLYDDMLLNELSKRLYVLQQRHQGRMQ